MWDASLSYLLAVRIIVQANMRLKPQPQPPCAKDNHALVSVSLVSEYKTILTVMHHCVPCVKVRTRPTAVGQRAGRR